MADLERRGAGRRLVFVISATLRTIPRMVQRAREITSGAPLSLDRDDDKNPVVALREIAVGKVGAEVLKRNASAPTPGAS